MSQVPLPKVKAGKAAEIYQHFNLKEETRPLLRDGSTPREFIEVLLAQRLFAAGIEFLAHALPPREAIWWGCLCLRHAGGPQLPPPEQAAAKAAAQWVLDPKEENRAAAQAPAEAAGIGTPAGALAHAARWTGGSLSPPDLPAVPPGPFMPAKAVAGSILLAAAKADPVKIADNQRLFLELGVGVAEGRFTWPEGEEKPSGRRA